MQNNQHGKNKDLWRRVQDNRAEQTTIPFHLTQRRAQHEVQLPVLLSGRPCGLFLGGFAKRRQRVHLGVEGKWWNIHDGKRVWVVILNEVFHQQIHHEAGVLEPWGGISASLGPTLWCRVCKPKWDLIILCSTLSICTMCKQLSYSSYKCYYTALKVSNHGSPVRFTTLTLQWFCPDNSQYWPKENADTGLLFYLYHHPCPRQCWQRRRSEQVALQHLLCLNSAGLLLMTSWSSGTVFPLEKNKNHSSLTHNNKWAWLQEHTRSTCSRWFSKCWLAKVCSFLMVH